MDALPAVTTLAADLVRRQFTETDVPEPAPREPRFLTTRLAVATALEWAASTVRPAPDRHRRLGSGAWQG